MNGILDIMSARADLYDRAIPTRSYLDYVIRHKLDVLKLGGFCGAFAVTRILAFDGGMFDFADDDYPDGFDGAVCEAFDKDGQTVLDLVAWPLDRPHVVLSMYRRAALLGMWSAMNPASYYLGRKLDLYRNGLEWLRADCAGAAVVVPHLATQTLFLDLPGNFAARDPHHAAELERLRQTLGKGRMFVAPARRAA